VNRVDAEVDIRLALRKMYAEGIVYPLTGGYTDDVITVSGDVDGIPYGDIYKQGDYFTEPVGAGLLGKIYYVAFSEANNPTIKLQQEVSRGQARPKVVIVEDFIHFEVNDPRVHIGIRSRGTARSGFVRALYGGRVLHVDRGGFVLTEPFWRGSFWLHVEGKDRFETAYVFSMVNSRQKLITDIYKFEIDFVPIRVDVVNLEANGVFRNVLTANVTARCTADTPVHQLPDGMPEVYFGTDIITGVSPVIEDWDRGEPFPWYAERVGNYPLSQEADDAGVADMPPTE